MSVSLEQYVGDHLRVLRDWLEQTKGRTDIPYQVRLAVMRNIEENQEALRRHDELRRTIDRLNTSNLEVR